VETRAAFLDVLRGVDQRQRLAELRALLHDLNLAPHDLIPPADDDADADADSAAAAVGDGETVH
jgi:hypothetical protein